MSVVWCWCQVESCNRLLMKVGRAGNYVDACLEFNRISFSNLLGVGQ